MKRNWHIKQIWLANFLLGFVLLCLVLIVSNSANAQTIHTWTGAGTNDLVSNNANWVGNASSSANNAGQGDTWRFGDEGAGGNYIVTLDQGASNPPAQNVGRFEFIAGAQSYTLNAQSNPFYRLYGTAAGGSAPAGEFVSILNTSGVMQYIDLRVRQESNGNVVQYNVYDSGTGGITFLRDLEFANNAKDLHIRGSGDVIFEGNIDNTTGSSVNLVIQHTGTVEVRGTIIDVPGIRIESGTLLLSSTAADIIDDSNNAAKCTNLTMAGGVTTAQLSQIKFVDPFDERTNSQFFGVFDATILSTGEIVPIIPEPQTVWAGALMLVWALVYFMKRHAGSGEIFQRLRQYVIG